MNLHAEVTDEAAIRALIDRCADGFREMDIDAIMACHTEDVVCFDCHSQFEAKGAPAMRAFLEACAPYMEGPITHRVHELAVASGGDSGFAHYHIESSCRDLQEGEHAGWLRVTLGLRRTDGGWKASHAHISAPFNPITNQTMFGMARDANPFAGGAA